MGAITSDCAAPARLWPSLLRWTMLESPFCHQGSYRFLAGLHSAATAHSCSPLASAPTAATQPRLAGRPAEMTAGFLPLVANARCAVELVPRIRKRRRGWQVAC